MDLLYFAGLVSTTELQGFFVIFLCFFLVGIRMNIPSPSFIEYQPVESLIVLDLIIWEGLMG